jgi:hypothetical protein
MSIFSLAIMGIKFRGKKKNMKTARYNYNILGAWGFYLACAACTAAIAAEPKAMVSNRLAIACRQLTSNETLAFNRIEF